VEYGGEGDIDEVQDELEQFRAAGNDQAK
jgi:hypothetical protein